MITFLTLLPLVSVVAGWGFFVVLLLKFKADMSDHPIYQHQQKAEGVKNEWRPERRSKA